MSADFLDAAERRDVMVACINYKLVEHIRTEWLKLAPEELADKLDYPADTIIDGEAGVTVLTVVFMARLSRATGISLARIYAGVQVIDKWLWSNYASAIDLCFTMSDPTRRLVRIHKLIETGIRQMPETLRVSFAAPLKVTPVPAAPPPAPAAPATRAPTTPAITILPPRMPKPLTPTNDKLDYDSDDDEPEPEPLDADEARPPTQIVPMTPGTTVVPMTPAPQTPFELAPGARRRPGRPRKNPTP